MADKKGRAEARSQQKGTARNKPGEATPLTVRRQTRLHKNDNGSFYIVGIGASAGGLEAFEQFFMKMPADSGLAFVLIPHLDPAYLDPALTDRTYMHER